MMLMSNQMTDVLVIVKLRLDLFALEFPLIALLIVETE